MQFMPRLYNEGQLPLEECLEMAVRRVGDWYEMATSLPWQWAFSYTGYHWIWNVSVSDSYCSDGTWHIHDNLKDYWSTIELFFWPFLAELWDMTDFFTVLDFSSFGQWQCFWQEKFNLWHTNENKTNFQALMYPRHFGIKIYELCDKSVYIYGMDFCLQKDRTCMSETWQQQMQLWKNLRKRLKDMDICCIWRSCVYHPTYLMIWQDGKSTVVGQLDRTEKECHRTCYHETDNWNQVIFILGQEMAWQQWSGLGEISVMYTYDKYAQSTKKL
jgi:hypothetical protein